MTAVGIIILLIALIIMIVLAVIVGIGTLISEGGVKETFLLVIFLAFLLYLGSQLG